MRRIARKTGRSLLKSLLNGAAVISMTTLAASAEPSAWDTVEESTKPEPRKKERPTNGRSPASFRPKKSKKSPSPQEPVAPPSKSGSEVVPPAAEQAPAGPVDTIPSDHAPSGGEENFGLTGNWGGTRTRLLEKGLGFALVTKNETSRTFHGGVRKGNANLVNVDAKIFVDAEKLMGWKGATFFVYGLGNWGGAGSHQPGGQVGDLQWTSNIQAFTDTIKLYELWYDQKFADDRASLLVGIHDLNADFYFTDSATLFLHSSFGLGLELSQTSTGGPSIFPYTTSALRLKFEPSSNYYFQTGVFAANSAYTDDLSKSRFSPNPKNGYLLIQEAGIVESGESAHKFAVGGWTYTRSFDHRTDTATDSDGNEIPQQVTNSGAYLLAEKSLGKGWSAFWHGGFASSKVNDVHTNWLVGVVNKGVFGLRDDDQVGLGFTTIHSSDHGVPEEGAIEFTYRMQLHPGFIIQPDLQYVRNPSFSTEVPNAWWGALRLEIGL